MIVSILKLTDGSPETIYNSLLGWYNGFSAGKNTKIIPWTSIWFVNCKRYWNKHDSSVYFNKYKPYKDIPELWLRKPEKHPYILFYSYRKQNKRMYIFGMCDIKKLLEHKEYINLGSLKTNIEQSNTHELFGDNVINPIYIENVFYRPIDQLLNGKYILQRPHVKQEEQGMHYEPLRQRRNYDGIYSIPLEDMISIFTVRRVQFTYRIYALWKLMCDKVGQKNININAHSVESKFFWKQMYCLHREYYDLKKDIDRYYDELGFYYCLYIATFSQQFLNVFMVAQKLLFTLRIHMCGEYFIHRLVHEYIPDNTWGLNYGVLQFYNSRFSEMYFTPKHNDYVRGNYWWNTQGIKQQYSKKQTEALNYFHSCKFRDGPSSSISNNLVIPNKPVHQYFLIPVDEMFADNGLVKKRQSCSYPYVNVNNKNNQHIDILNNMKKDKAWWLCDRERLIECIVEGRMHSIKKMIHYSREYFTAHGFECYLWTDSKDEFIKDSRWVKTTERAKRYLGYYNSRKTQFEKENILVMVKEQVRDKQNTVWNKLNKMANISQENFRSHNIQESIRESIIKTMTVIPQFIKASHSEAIHIFTKNKILYNKYGNDILSISSWNGFNPNNTKYENIVDQKIKGLVQKAIVHSIGELKLPQSINTISLINNNNNPNNNNNNNNIIIKESSGNKKISYKHLLDGFMNVVPMCIQSLINLTKWRSLKHNERLRLTNYLYNIGLSHHIARDICDAIIENTVVNGGIQSMKYKESLITSLNYTYRGERAISNKKYAITCNSMIKEHLCPYDIDGFQYDFIPMGKNIQQIPDIEDLHKTIKPLYTKHIRSINSDGSVGKFCQHRCAIKLNNKNEKSNMMYIGNPMKFTIKVSEFINRSAGGSKRKREEKQMHHSRYPSKRIKIKRSNKINNNNNRQENEIKLMNII